MLDQQKNPSKVVNFLITLDKIHKMGLKVVLLLVLSMIVCSFYGKDFQSVNRHSWKCQARMEEVNPVREEETPEINNIPGELKCICGKICKGLRGLRSHQRSCRSIKHMGDEISMNDAVHDLSGNVAKRSVLLEETPKVKSGIKLPNNSEEWKIANIYFQSSLSTIDITRVRISHALDEFNRVTYDYFNENYGLINNKDQQEIN